MVTPKIGTSYSRLAGLIMVAAFSSSPASISTGSCGGVYVIVPASVSGIIIFVTIFIIFSRDVVLVSLVSVWFGVRDFMLHSIKDFQSDGVFPREPPDQLVNVSGEQ